MLKRIKLFTNTAAKSLDEKTRTAEYIISSDVKDRMGEVVEQSWDLENYKKNPIVLFGHDPSTAENVLGKCLSIETKEDGDAKLTTAKVQFADEGTSKTVDTVWSLVKQNILRTVSVGFIPHTFKTLDDDNETSVLADNELLEFSLVPIPANPQAVALAYADGSIAEKDARFMVKAYETEAEYLKGELYDTIKKTHQPNDKETKGMSDEEIAKLAEALATSIEEKVGAKLDAILEKLDGDDSDNEPDEPEDKPEDDTPQEMAEDTAPEDEGDTEDDEEEEAEKALLKELDEMTDAEVSELAKSLGM